MWAHERPLGFDSQDPKAEIAVKWWKPADSEELARTKWTPWLEGGGRHSQTRVARGALAVANVTLWNGSNNLNRRGSSRPHNGALRYSRGLRRTHCGNRSC